VNWSAIARWDPLRLGRREQMMAATTVAALIIFLGLLLDVPSGKRVKMLQTERRALEGEIATLKSELDQLGGPVASASTESERDQTPAVDPRFSALLGDMAAIAGRAGVEFIAVRPAPSAAGATAAMVELNAPFRVIGSYLEELERSRWRLAIDDVHLARNQDRAASVTARFTVAAPMVLSGLATVGSAGGVEQ
jgi:hypothetical protein